MLCLGIGYAGLALGRLHLDLQVALGSLNLDRRINSSEMISDPLQERNNNQLRGLECVPTIRLT